MGNDPTTTPEPSERPQEAEPARLVLCLHAMPEVGATAPPRWVDYLVSTVASHGVGIYTPIKPIIDQRSEPLLAAIQAKVRVPEAALEGLPPWLAAPPGQHLALAEASGNRSHDVVNVQTYMLLRSSAVLVDLEGHVGMGTGIPLMLADQLGIPCIGIGSAFVLNPWLDRLLKARFPASRDGLSHAMAMVCSLGWNAQAQEREQD